MPAGFDRIKVVTTGFQEHAFNAIFKILSGWLAMKYARAVPRFYRTVMIRSVRRRSCNLTMSDLTIRRVGWAGYVVTTELGTKVVVDPYLHGSENSGIHAGVVLPESPVTIAEFADAKDVAVTHAGIQSQCRQLSGLIRGR